MDLLPAEYNHEPVLALKADDNGLWAGDFLTEKGLLIVEAGESRDAVDEKFSDIPFTWLTHESGEEAVFVLNKKDIGSLR